MSQAEMKRLADAIKNANAHGYPCNETAARLIKTDIAEAISIDFSAYQQEAFLRMCGVAS